jgi:hypothetical protein
MQRRCCRRLEDYKLAIVVAEGLGDVMIDWHHRRQWSTGELPSVCMPLWIILCFTHIVDF